MEPMNQVKGLRGNPMLACLDEPGHKFARLLVPLSRLLFKPLGNCLLNNALQVSRRMAGPAGLFG